MTDKTRQITSTMVADMDWINRCIKSMDSSGFDKELVATMNDKTIEFAKGMLFEKRRLLQFIQPLLIEIANGEWSLSPTWTRRAKELQKLLAPETVIAKEKPLAVDKITPVDP